MSTDVRVDFSSGESLKNLARVGNDCICLHRDTEKLIIFVRVNLNNDLYQQMLGCFFCIFYGKSTFLLKINNFYGIIYVILIILKERMFLMPNKRSTLPLIITILLAIAGGILTCDQYDRSNVQN